MLSNIINRIKLPFREDKELYLSLREIIGFYPHNISYYKQALMHKSAGRNAKGGKFANNERLEFLGDAILDAIAGHIVYDHFPGKKEGFLTNTRSKLVKRSTLGKLAKEMGVTKLIVSNTKNQSHNSYVGGNAFEALVGAIYLDQGYNACMKFMKKRILGELINIDKMAAKEENFKSKLLEWSQKNHIDVEFRSIEETIDDNNNQIFRFEVIAQGISCGEGSGYSKKESQQKAAKAALAKIQGDSSFRKEIYDAKFNEDKKSGLTDSFDENYDGSEEHATINPYGDVGLAAAASEVTDDPEIETNHENIIAAAEAAAFAE